MEDKDILIFYHGESNCPDGFGGAYAAWKKFGDNATYIPLTRTEAPDPERARGKEVYFIDFCYNAQETMDAFASVARTLTVLDHHHGVQEVVESMPHHVFDNNRSGAGIAWDYFHPNTKRPELLNYVEDDDIYRFALRDTRAVLCYLTMQPLTFESWDAIARDFDDPIQSAKILEKANTYAEYFELLAEHAVKKAKLVSFEGYECYFANCHPLKPLKSLVGHLLAKKKGPVALVVSAHPNGFGVSIRGDESVDVSEIAKRFGGGGHKNSGGFMIHREDPFPWTLIDETDEDSSD